MADPFGLLSPNDLAGFSQRVEAADPYGLIGRSLQSWQPDVSRMGATESGLTSFGRAFLSGLATNYAQNRAAEQLSSVVNILPQLTKDPYSVGVPEGVDSGAFNLLRGTAIVNKGIKDIYLGEEGRQSVGDILKTVLGEGVKSGAITPAEALEAAKTGKLPGKLTGVGDPLKNPNSPGVKASDALRQELARNPEVATFTDVRDRLKVLQQAVNDPSVVADLDYVYGVAKILDPGSVVRESEGQNIIASNSIPGTVLGQMNKMLAGESAIPRKELFGLAKRHYDMRSERVGAILDNYSRLASERGADPVDVLPFSRESLVLQGLGSESIDPNREARIRQDAQRLKAMGKSPAEVAAELRAFYGAS